MSDADPLSDADASRPPEPHPAAPAPPPTDATLPGDGERTQLPERVVSYWRWSAALSGMVILAIASAIVMPIPGLPDAVRALILVVILGLIAVDIVVVQRKRRDLWWYAIGSDQIDLEHGWLIVTRTVVPMTRVQHVELKRGPLADRFDLAALEIFTAAGSVTIPALDRTEGEHIRQQIADLARIADDL